MKTQIQKIDVSAKNALIAGGAGTLGKSIAGELARRGFRLAIADLDVERCQHLTKKIRFEGGDASCFALDVTDPGSWQSLHDELRDRWTNIDLLVNSAGCMAAGEFAQSEWEQWAHVVNVNLMGTALGCRTFAEWLTVPDYPTKVMNISSIAGFLPLPWGSAYAVSKSGVLALSESLQAEWQPRNVQVTTVCPGFFESGLFPNGAFHDKLVENVVDFFVQRSRITAEQVAVQAVDGLERGRRYIILPRRARWMHRLKRLAPGWVVRKISREAHRLRARIRNEMSD